MEDDLNLQLEVFGNIEVLAESSPYRSRDEEGLWWVRGGSDGGWWGGEGIDTKVDLITRDNPANS